MQQKRYSSDLTERQWQRIAPLFVVQRTGKWPLRAIVHGIFYVLKHGFVWRDVPVDLPPWVPVYYYFAKWSADGTWERVSGCLSIGARERAKKGPAHRRYPRQSKREAYGHQHGPRGLRRGQTYQGAQTLLYGRHPTQFTEQLRIGR